MTTKRHLILSVNALTNGHHEGAWRLPSSEPERLTDATYFEGLAKTAERGKFDLFFLADFQAFSDGLRHDVRWAVEPISLMAAIAGSTERIGLVATGSTTYSEPYALARTFATLDHITGGRAGWNIVTSGDPQIATNFNRTAQIPHHERYVHGHEFVEVVTRLWDSWSSGRPEAIDHVGERISVAGPLNIPPSPQGYPLLVQAGSSEDGRDFAGRYAEVVFTAQTTIEQARAFRDDVRGRAKAYGRSPDSIKTLPGFAPVLGSTQEEADRLKGELDDLILPEKIVRFVSGWGFDLTGYDLDDPFPIDMTLDPAWDGITSRFAVIKDVASVGETLTIRQFARKIAGSRGHASLIGTPEQVAGRIEEWWRADATDGFMIMPTHFPDALDDFVDQVIPLLQDRGVVQREYAAGTLRQRLGLPKLVEHATAVRTVG